jgi:hypothetical protein
MAAIEQDQRVMPILRLRIITALNATSNPLEVARLPAGCLAQAAGKPLPADDAPFEDSIRAIASLVPQPFTLASTLPDAVTKVVVLAAALYAPLPIVTATPTAIHPPLTTHGAVIVETPANRDNRERYIAVQVRSQE